MLRIKEEEYSWYTDQVMQRKCTKEGLGGRRLGMADKTINIRDTSNQTRLKEQTEIKQMENKSNTPHQHAPIFASFAGMDLLGMGLRKTF